MKPAPFASTREPDPGRVLGRPLPRLEDPPLVTGRGQFVADLGFPHQLHMRVVRSPYAHAVLRSVHTGGALAAPGVVAVWTAAEIADLPPIDFRDPAAEALRPYRQPLLARERLRYVGEPVAAVFATDPYLAEDAAELVTVAAEELPPLLDAEAPPGQFAPGLSTEAVVLRAGYGDVEAALAAAHAVVALDLSIGRHSGVPLETRGALARYDAARDVLELYGAAKVPHRNRDSLARMLDRSTTGVVLREGNTGGGFGVRGELYPEDFLVCVAAMRLGRPVKWIEDRHEHLIAANHSREQHHHVRAAVDAEGHILALDDEFRLDQGAYVRTHGARVADMTIAMLPGAYRIPAYRAVGHFRLTNKTPAATYRSPGRFEGTFVRERLLDAIADRLGIDRVTVRRRNLIAGTEMPFSRPLHALGTEVVYDSGDYPAMLDQALAKIGWDELQEDLRRRRAAGELVGCGIAIFVEKGGLGPLDGARVTVDTTGAVELVTGGSAVGQGFATAMAQICADTLGVDYRRVRVVAGQTDRIQYGIGAHASRASVMTGNATHAAALKVRAKALEVAAELLQAAPEELDIIDGAVIHRDRPGGGSIGLAEIARHLAPDSPTLGKRDPGLAAEGWFRTDHMTYAGGVQIGVVRVDAETGEPTIERFLLAYDIGRAINPMLVEGQLVGGFVQGLGGAVYEEFRYDQRGEPLCVTFADYLLPGMHETPPVELLVTEDAPSPLNPLGIKSVGEGGINGVGAVIAAAIDEAIGIPGAVTRLPATPQRIKALLREGQASRGMTLLTLLNAPTLAAYTAAGFWGGETIYHLAARHARTTPNAFAVRDRHRRLSYSELVTAADRLAAYLAGRGMRAGQRVALWLPSRIETAIALLACSRNAYVCSPSLHRDHRVGEVAALVDRMRAAALIAAPNYAADADHHDIFAEVAERDFLRCAWRVGPTDAAPFSDLPEPAIDTEPSRDPNQIMYLPFTSGTTGEPKGVLHSDNTLLATARMMARDWRLESAVLYTMSPLSHNLGLGALITALAGGGELVLHDLPRGASLLGRLEETGAEFLFGVPTHAIDLLNEARARGVSRIGAVRGFRISGAAAPPQLITELMRYGVVPQSGYGMTETCSHQYTRPDDPPERIAETCGRACAGYEIRIWRQDDPDTEVPPGETGEIGGRGASLMLGYFDDQRATEAAFNAGGWFMTGDLGWLDEAGYLHVTGRKKEVIIRGGRNIHPAKIEALALRHEAIEKAAAFAISDPRLGERVCLAVVTRAGERIDPAAVLEHLDAAGLPRYDMPEFILPMSKMPLTASGKLLKRELVRRVAKGELQPLPVRLRSRSAVSG